MAQATKSTSSAICKCGKESKYTWINIRVCQSCYDKLRGCNNREASYHNLLGLKKFNGMTIRQFDGEMLHNELRDVYGITSKQTTVCERIPMVTVLLDESDTKSVLTLIEKCSHRFSLNFDCSSYLLSIYL